MMNCKQATRLLSDAQERNLSFTERATLKMHVMMCAGCNNFSKQMYVLRDFAHAYTQDVKENDDKEK